MARISKRKQQSHAGIDRGMQYGLQEAVTLVKSRASAKFDETVDVAVVCTHLIALEQGTESSLRSSLITRCQSSIIT